MTQKTQGTETPKEVAERVQAERQSDLQVERRQPQGEVVEAQAIVKQEQPEPQSQALAMRTLSPAEMLSLAVQNKADTATLEKLMDLQDRHEAKIARQAFEVAMVNFSARVPTIIKTRVVDFTTQKGRTHYTHAGLPETVEQIQELMAECQLSRRWKDEEPKKVGNIRIRCIVSHIMTHSESFAAEAPPDTSGNKNDAQAVASVITYLRRTTLFSVLGLVAKDEVDDDGAGGKKTEPEKPQSGELLDADESAAKKNFAQECHVLAGGKTQLTSAELRDLLTQARMLSGKAKIAECAEWLRGKRIVKGSDGRRLIESPQAEQPTAAADPDPLDAAVEGDLAYECEKCLARYMVIPAGGQCTARVDARGTRCPGKVARSME